MVNRVTKRLDNSSSLQTEVVSVGNNALMDWGVRGSEDLQRVCLQLHKVSKKHQSRHNITLKVPTVSPPNLSDLHLRSKIEKLSITMANKRGLSKLCFMGNYYNFRNINSSGGVQVACGRESPM
ncbi:hypothetical protein B0I73DRAFT_163438 [Yarrowia lipolytica]|nr:hypothetical protein B0I73DRAFT_163438 [Yarrowia lipolytica]RDW43601.1 hypothetical protein B0I74DRAFT_161867 [Yarrowia lipolytica]RDW50670.1 hypothetical protein B0I75DRAFT_167052 [Yarrowia lipolytica]